MHLLFLYLLFSFFLNCVNPTAPPISREVLEIQNPVVPGDFADPSVIRVGDQYYAVGTSSEWAPHFPVFKSKDLVSWKQTGYVFDKAPAWTSSSFWAPEFFYHNNTYYVYYVAKRKSDGMSCIGVATSNSPDGKFTDHGVLFTHGKEAIDPFIINDNGQLYITFKAYGLDDRPIELMAYKLSNDGLKVIGEPVSLLKDDQRQLMEGQSLIKRNDYYYMFYSAGGCCGAKCSYHVMVARAKSVLGPYEKYDANPILKGGDEWICPGHGTVVETPDKRYYYMYHAYSKENNIYTGREGMLDEVLWNEENGWPYFKNKFPTVDKSKQTSDDKYKIADDFTSSKLSQFWQWDFRNAEPSIALKKGNLYLAGKPGSKNPSGTALTVRPFYGDYQFESEVINSNSSVKGLVLYGDASQAVGIGVQNNKVLLWEVKEAKRRTINTANVPAGKSVKLKMEVEDGYQCKFFYALKDGNWKELKQDGKAFYEGKFLPQWDRSPRLGLIHSGDLNQPAAFSYFKVDYKN
jgi:beta-xylosidase